MFNLFPGVTRVLSNTSKAHEDVQPATFAHGDGTMEQALPKHVYAGSTTLYSSHIAQDDKESKVSSSLPFILVDDPGDNFGDLLNNLPKLVMESRSESTANKYCSYWVRWKLFIENRGHSPLPAKGIHVALFLVYLLEQKFSSNSILSFVYSIKMGP